jgi:transposase
MDGRKERGRQIAAQNSIRKTPKGYLVPSQSGKGKYAVIVSGAKPTCTCPDHESHGGSCKHIFAVSILIQQELVFDGQTVRETVTVTKTVTRQTYTQDWPAYNAAQTNEKDQFMVLLRDLCAGPPEHERKGAGRPRLSPRDAVFAAVFKVYTTVSARRSMSDMREARKRGYLSKVPCHNSVLKALESADLTPILRDLIVESSRPLSAVESEFAADSSGFCTSRFIKWFDHKYGAVRQRHDWVKVHIMTGVKTNIVTAIEIHDRDASDTKQLPALVATTAEHFAMAEVSADKAYGSIQNADAIASVGATPFIAFKANHSGTGSHRPGKNGAGAWEKAFGYFLYRRDEFMEHYHRRSNVESTFSMIKRKFGDSVRSKTDVAMANEAMCKVLAHNLVVLIHEMYELGIEPAFWPQQCH